MTKRALSLLLTLVMVLSLCVPALAAEDFEAEAPAEVVEEAPEAPEAPVAPEAEEPADEPVVDEPAAEEPVEEPVAEDVPEMASIMPEDAEDLPYLVALGVVSGTNHYNLEKVLKKADELMPKVEAGELYVKASYDEHPIGNKDYAPAKAFTDAYALAKKNLDAINGLTVDIDVNDETVKYAIANLKKYLPDDNGNYQELTDELIDSTDSLTNKNNAAALYDALKNGASYSDAKTAPYSTKATVYNRNINYPAAIFTAINKDTKFTGPDWTMSYKSDYLTALETAQKAIKTFAETNGATFKDFSKAAEAVLAAAKLEASAASAGSAEATALSTVVKKAEDIKDNYLKATNAGDYVAYNGNLYESGNPYKNAKGLQNDTLGLNGLADNVKYYDVNKAIKDITDAITLKDNTLKIESVEAVAPNYVKLVVSIKNVGDGSNKVGDGTSYGFDAKVNNSWWELGKSGGTATKSFVESNCVREIGLDSGNAVWAVGNERNDQDPTRLYFTYRLPCFNEDGNNTINYKTGDKITFRLFEITTKGSDKSYYKCDEKTYEFPNQSYFGPKIKSVSVTGYESSVSKSLSEVDTLDKLVSSIGGGALSSDYYGTAMPKVTVTLTSKFTDDTNNAGRLVFVKNTKNEKLNAGVEVAAANDSIDVNTYTSADKFTVSGLKATLDVSTTAGKLSDSAYAVAQDTKALTVKPLSTWSQVKYINKVLKEAGELVPSDYDLNTSKLDSNGYITGRTDINSVATAFQTIQNDVAKINKDINDSNKANTCTNREAVVKTLSDLGTVYTYLKAKAPNAKTLNDLQREVRNLKETDYTYDSWGKMMDAFDDATKALDSGLQSRIDKAATALKAAKDALVKEGAVDKTALTAAIASAKALKEADYTPESWAANKATIDAAVKAAQAVVDNAQATQAQVTAALNALNAAVGKLEKVKPDEPEGPKAPASGTGWNYYNNEWYFFKNGKLVSNYWVGKIDGASQWDSNWYYVGSDGKMLTGMQYLDDLHGGYGWYFLQPTNTKQEIGKMLTGYQWVGGQYGECYFSKASGSSGKCTWSELLGNWNGTTWVK